MPFYLSSQQFCEYTFMRGDVFGELESYLTTQLKSNRISFTVYFRYGHSGHMATIIQFIQIARTDQI